MIEQLKRYAVPLLRRSERYTRTDMLYLTKGGFWLLLGYAMQLVSGVVLTVALANLLPKESYGTYQFVISMSAIIGGLTLTGLGTALMRNIARGGDASLAAAFRLQMTWSIGIVLAAAAVSAYYFANGNATLATAFIIVGAALPLLSGFSLYRPYLEGRQLFRESTTMGLWRRPIPVIVLLLTLLATDDPVLLILAYFASHTLSTGLLYLAVWQRYRKEAAATDPELVTYSKHLSVMGLVGLAANNLDNIIVFHYLGAAALAVYALSRLPATHLLKMFSLAGNLVFPKFAQRDFSTLRQTIHFKLLWYMAAAAGATAFYLLAAPFIYKLLFPNYEEAILLSQVLVLVVLTKPFALYAQAFAAHGRKGVQHFLQVSMAAVKLGLLIVLLPLYGLWGAAAAFIITAVYWAIAVSVLFYATRIPVTAS